MLGLEFPEGAAAAVAAILVAAALAWHLRRSRAPRRLKALRAAGLAGLALALLRPNVAVRSPLEVKPRLAVVLDAGHSMSARAGGGTRLDEALAFLKKNRKRLEARADVVFYAGAGRGRRLAGWDEALALKPSEAAFDPAQALADVSADPAGAQAERTWLLSDGDVEAGQDGGVSLAWPMDAVAAGPRLAGAQLWFGEVVPPAFAFLHGNFGVAASVVASGLSGKTVRLRLSRQRADGGWDPVQESQAAVSSDFEERASSWTAAAQSLGQERYRFEASAPGAKTVTREFRVEVVRQKYRIMYLSGRPSPEYSFLREFLKSDPNHELVSFVILRNPDNPTLVPDNELSLIPFPAEEIFVQDLSQFDLFILENFSYSRFHLPPAYLASLRDFVSRGGALLVIGGENSFDLGGYRGTPLEEMLPVTLAGTAPDFLPGLFSPKPAAQGHPLVQLYDTPQESAQAWAALPKLDGHARFGSVRPSATVLAVHPDEKTESGQPSPVAAIRDFGRGKVMLLATDSTWRWRLGAASDWRTGSFYARFWSRVVEYLTGTLDLSKVKFAPLPQRLPAREPAVFSLRVFDEAFRPVERSAAQVTVLWTPPGKPPRQVPAEETEPGQFSIELTGLSPGQHRLRASASYRGRPWGQDELRFAWESSEQETPVDRRWLKKTAEAAGGSLYELSDSDLGSLLDRLPPVRDAAQVRKRYQPWASPWWLWATALALVAEWGLRRRLGLP